MMLLAQTSSTSPAPRYAFRTLGPLLDQPGGFAAAVALGTVVLLLVAWMYWRERSSLSPAQIIPLLFLRLGALVGVVLYGLAPEKRDARQEIRPSRVLVLVDDSLSMALDNADQTSEGESVPRWQAVQKLLEEELIGTLQENHEVHVAATSNPRTTAVFGLLNANESDSPSVQPELSELLAARTSHTRLGDTILQAMSVYSGGPLAGIILASDGQNNGGASPELAASSAEGAGIAIHTIGLGSETPAKNIAIRDLLAPRRVYPKDQTPVTVFVESQGFDGQSVSLSLYSKWTEEQAASANLVATKNLQLDASQGPQKLSFVTTPEKAGVYEFEVRVATTMEEVDSDDNTATVEVQVVDRMLKAMLIAGGPTRDYHFLRDQLRRDDAFTVDVLLQSAASGVSQDANKVLQYVPTDREKLKEYDLFIAFDADWARITDETAAAIEQCVSQRGAGLLFVAGPVNTPRWLREDASPVVLNLLPVRPAPLPLLLGATERSHTRPSKVELSRAGADASFLWVRGDQETSLDFWRQFPGFYSTAETSVVKPGATVYAETPPRDNPDTARPRVLFAEQFYGAGRCFYIGAPEMWRLRSADPATLRAFNTKLLQHLAQGRLLADSPAGSLLFERDRYSVGDTLTLRATLSESVEQELSPDAELAAQLESPNGGVINLPLAKPDTPGGAWTASHRAQIEGAHVATLQLPNSAEPLSAKTAVRVPALERSRTERNAELLSVIAENSTGSYYPTLAAVMDGAEGLTPLPDAIPSRTETLTLYGAPDDEFARKVSSWLLGVIAGCLIAEWTARRVLSLS